MKKSNKSNKSNKPTVFDNTQAYREGWGLFYIDRNTFRILVLDDPQSIHESYPKRAVFNEDEDAVDFVTYAASQGSRYHKKALKLHTREE
ncbi:MAG: hypothetical protein LLG04_08680 [Parachlamydia sp.]|nr:hypothetical protein [Parachlamydia sp.]